MARPGDRRRYCRSCAFGRPMACYARPGMYCWKLVAEKGLRLEPVARSILSINGVQEVHDIHIWTIGTDLLALSCHICIPDMHMEETERILKSIREKLEADFHISHTTVQFERAGACHKTRGYFMPQPSFNPRSRIGTLAVPDKLRRTYKDRQECLVLQIPISVAGLIAKLDRECRGLRSSVGSRLNPRLTLKSSGEFRLESRIAIDLQSRKMPMQTGAAHRVGQG